MSLALATISPGEPEIFASFQGEGPSAGQPCAFIRLSRCNLACTWCDTAYTWHFTGDTRPHRSGETFDRPANQVTLSERLASEQIAALGQDRLVITGGEPMMQAPALAKMLELLPPMFVEIETNGTVAPIPALDRFITQYNVSPKLAHSGNPADLALIPERLGHWAGEQRAFLKFVIAQPSDVDEVLALAERHSIPRTRIWLMPEGTDTETLHAREQWLGPLCERHGFSLSHRLHIEKFGDTRGT
jgi:organic radical activating enzyme